MAPKFSALPAQVKAFTGDKKAVKAAEKATKKTVKASVKKAKS